MIEDDERTSSADLLEVEYNSMDECIIRIKLGSKKFVFSTVDQNGDLTSYQPYFNRTTTWNDFELGELPSYEYKAPQTKKCGIIQKEVMRERDQSLRMIEQRYLSQAVKKILVTVYLIVY